MMAILQSFGGNDLKITDSPLLLVYYGNENSEAPRTKIQKREERRGDAERRSLEFNAFLQRCPNVPHTRTIKWWCM